MIIKFFSHTNFHSSSNFSCKPITYLQIKMISIQIVVISIFLLVPCIISSIIPISCNNTQPCNASAALTCTDSSCACILPDAMVFDSESGSCRSVVGESCGILSVGELPEVLLQCVAHAYCSNGGECVCHSHFYKGLNSQGVWSCLAQKEFGALCNSSAECENSLGLVCVDEACGCDSKSSINSNKFFDDEVQDQEGRDQRHCLGRPGSVCLAGKCVPNAECRDGECLCSEGYESSKKQKICVAQFNKSCDSQSNQFCRKDFSCLGGLCRCKHPAHQMYNSELETCVSLVGGPCGPGVSCVSNANCRGQRKSEGGVTGGGGVIYQYCECEEGFVENGNRTCAVAYGFPCSQILEDWSCDSSSGLVCRDGNCRCPDPGQVFDAESQSCRALVGSFCEKNPKNSRSLCVSNAHCVLHGRNGHWSFGHCECNEDFEPTSERTCS